MAASASQGRAGFMSTVKLFPQSFPKYQGQESDLQADWRPVRETRSGFKGRGLAASALPSHRSVPTKEPPGPRGSAFKPLASQ